jgi:hypothetical protein
MAEFENHSSLSLDAKPKNTTRGFDIPAVAVAGEKRQTGTKNGRGDWI